VGRPLWFVELTKAAYPLRYIAAELTHLPLVGRFVDHWLFKGDRLLCLPLDQVIPVDEPVDDQGDVVLPSQVVEHFIAEANGHWIMDRCICRDAGRCQEYPTDLGCLFLGEAALEIHAALGRRVTKEEALVHLRRCREAGLVHVVGRNKLDTVWLGVGPSHKLMTICSCCPCCCLWRMLPRAAPRIGARISRMPGVTVTVTKACLGCGACVQDICFVDAIHLSQGHAVISHDCRGCGRCVSVCPEGAISFSIDDMRFVEHSIARLSPLIDLS
jgi:ferredoxin